MCALTSDPLEFPSFYRTHLDGEKRVGGGYFTIVHFSKGILAEEKRKTCCPPLFLYVYVSVRFGSTDELN